MSLFTQFATDRKAEAEGVEITFGGQNENGTMPSFRIARMSKANKRYQKMLEVETKPHMHAIRNENLDPAIDDAIGKKIFIATVLLGWKNLQEPKLFTPEEHTETVTQGERVDRYVPFTPENADRLLTALPELYNMLREQAQKMSLFRAEEIAADSKI